MGLGRWEFVIIAAVIVKSCSACSVAFFGSITQEWLLRGRVTVLRRSQGCELDHCKAIVSDTVAVFSSLRVLYSSPCCAHNKKQGLPSVSISLHC